MKSVKIPPFGNKWLEDTFQWVFLLVLNQFSRFKVRKKKSRNCVQKNNWLAKNKYMSNAKASVWMKKSANSYVNGVPMAAYGEILDGANKKIH